MAEKSSELNIIKDSDPARSGETPPNDPYDKDTNDYALSKPADDPAANGAPEETEYIKAQIEETRSQMGETIDAIQEKLSFQNISEQVKEEVSEQINSALETARENVYEATIGKAGKFMQNVGQEISRSEVGKLARKNPFPLVLIGLGVGLLAYESWSGKKHRSAHSGAGNGENKNYRGGRVTSSVSTTLKSAPGKIGEAASYAYESISDKAGNILHSVSDATGSAYGSVAEAATSTYSNVGDFAGNAYEKIGDYGTQAREQYDYYIEENPLAVGAVALALGAAVGLAFPSTRYEGELMGEYRQLLLDKAQTAAGDFVEQVKSTATEAQKTLGSDVRKAFDETQKKIEKEVSKQGLTS